MSKRQCDDILTVTKKMKKAEVQENKEEEGAETEGEEEEVQETPAVLEIIKLNDKQESAVHAAMSGANVFITGSAGVGKSLTLEYVISKLREKQRVGVTGSTGIAAVQIGGITLNSFFSIHPSMVKTKKFRTCPAWNEIDTLIIDEISMLHPDLFLYLNMQAQHNRRNALPFGGVQLIVVGDFFQLPPVHKGPRPEVEFVFELGLWTTMFHDGKNLIIELTEVFRQRDRDFVSMLERIRRGKCNLSDTHTLSKLDSLAQNNYTKLFGRCNTVDERNTRELHHLPGKSQRYEISFAWEPAPNKSMFSSAEKNKYTKQTVASLPIGNQLALKVNAQVMMVANVCTEAGLANGSRGVVESFDPDDHMPIVQFDKIRVKVRAYDWAVQLGTRGKVIVSCIPLKLSYAITIHKSQGQSIDGLEVDLMNVWEYGQAYTSLSRAKSLERLVVKNFKSSCVKAHPKVIVYYALF
jgi:ATP-dependent DNA helicase PIF1